MSTNPLNNISRVYLEQVAIDEAQSLPPMERLKTDRDMFSIPKGERDAARERLLAKAKAKREKMKEETEIEEAVKGADPEMRKAAAGERKSGDKRLSPSTGKGYADQQKQQISYMDKLTKKNKNVVGLVTKEALDPVGKEDADIDNDGIDNDSNDKYIMKRRKAIGKAIAKKTVKEGFSNWREDLSEVMGEVNKKEKEEKITEKTVKNKIKINPNMGEAVENLGGTLLEMVEIDEMDYIIESVYTELLTEGYDEDDIEEALEYSLTEAKVTFGHDTAPEKKKSGLLSAAKERLSSLKKSAKAAVSRGARKVARGALGVARKMEGGDKTPSAAHTKPRKASTYHGIGQGKKVEVASSGSYKAPTTTKKKAEKPSDPWEGSATTPPKPKPKPKAKTKSVKPKEEGRPARKRKEGSPSYAEVKANIEAREKSKKKKKVEKKGKLDDLLTSIRNEQIQIDEKTLTTAETKEKERIVKSMKDRAADFEKRYPGRGKEVMYATATKMAKKIAEQTLEMQPKTQEPKEKPLDTSTERQKFSNLKMIQQKQQQLQKQKLNLQKQGKLPLETD